MLEVEGVTKTYGDLVAVDQVSFSVPQGQIVGFLGTNGAGKTTTMEMIAGCIGCDQGSVRICGFDVTTQPIEAKRHLGYLPDEPPLYKDMRVEDYIKYAGELRGLRGKKLQQRVDAVVQELELQEVSKRLIGNLSKGFKQRVGLAAAIIHEPDVLILDEPTEGLDPSQIVHIRELIKSLAAQHTIFLSSHILSEVQNTCDHIIIIHHGRIIKQGSYEEIVAGVSVAGRYHLVVRDQVSKLAEELQKVTGISNIRVVSEGLERVEFDIDEQHIDQLEQVASLAINGKYGLRELARNTRSLEEVFIQLTH